MTDSPHAAASPDQVFTSDVHTSWGIEIGRLRLAVTRTRDARTVGRAVAPPRPVPRAASPFAAGALAGMGAVALLVVGASAERPSAGSDRYMISVPVPGPAVRHLARPAPRKRAPGRATPPAAALAGDPSGETFDAGDEPYVARAMATGAFQEWEDAAGQRRFLTAGPARFADGRSCRAMALLVRLAEGGSHVRSAQRCTTGPVSDAPPPDVVAEPAN